MSTFVTIESYDKVHQAQVAKLALEQAGIESFLENETIISMDWFLSNAVGGIKLQVAQADSEEAMRILREVREALSAKQSSMQGIKIVCQCKECNKIVSFDGSQGGRVESCPKCHGYIDVPNSTDSSISPELVQKCLAKESETDSQGKGLLTNPTYVTFEILTVLCFAYIFDLKNALEFYLEGRFSPENLYVDAGFLADFLWIRSGVVLVLLAPLLVVFGIPRLDEKPRQASWLMLAAEGAGLAFLMFLLAYITSYLAPTEVQMIVVWPEAFDDQLIISSVLGILANSIAEELVMRVYMIDRIFRLFGQKHLALVVSALLFGSYHIYQGFWMGFIWATLVGIILGIYFVGTRRVFPLVLAHTLYHLSTYVLPY